jgi:hypothetical protein
VQSRPPQPPDRAPAPRYRKRGKGRSGQKSNSPQELSLNEFSRRAPNDDEWSEVITDILNSHDRTAAILVSAQIELKLQELILTYLPNGTVEIFLSPNGPLNGFYAKNQMAFAMGIIPKSLFEDLEIMRRVRNACLLAVSGGWDNV